jgi:long-subunit acyl-CoA synthetase (AMP-forming)
MMKFMTHNQVDLNIEEVESLVGKEMRDMLGGRLYVASCGGAHVSDTVLNFVRKQLKVKFYASRPSNTNVIMIKR